jgi:secondary thiamine-phosphate synthase enzyme
MAASALLYCGKPAKYDVDFTLPKLPSPAHHPQMPNTNTNATSYHLPLFLCLFTLAFFPSLIGPLLWSPLTLLTYSISLLPWSHTPTLPLQQDTSTTMSWTQKQFTLPAKARGSYLITDVVMDKVPEIKEYKTGILQLFVQHTSCALSLNENYDEDVRYVVSILPPSSQYTNTLHSADMSDALDRIAPEDRKGTLYRHADEGLDDMPAHIKSALIGASVSVPITNGKLNTGTWQGVWFLEFRAAKQQRKIVATVMGEKMK